MGQAARRLGLDKVGSFDYTVWQLNKTAPRGAATPTRGLRPQEVYAPVNASAILPEPSPAPPPPALAGGLVPPLYVTPGLLEPHGVFGSNYPQLTDSDIRGLIGAFQCPSGPGRHADLGHGLTHAMLSGRVAERELLRRALLRQMLAVYGEAAILDEVAAFRNTIYRIAGGMRERWRVDE